MADHAETIAALSTPVGESGIAVVRLSGPQALEILTSLYRTPSGTPSDNEWEHRRLYHGVIVGTDGEPIDDVMCAVMRAPETFTGEDVVEISGHGNTSLVTRILQATFASGARSAEAGEFTKRAFLNGKIDLIQAEAISDLIHAKSELQQRVAHEQLAGGLSKRINVLADEMLGILGVIEANIDFIEEGIDTIDVPGTLQTLAAHTKELTALLAHASLSRPFREGYRVTIAGPVNAGKSSIFNRLVGDTRAIVTELPGTTRDVLREPIVVDGLVFLIQDTAGLRGTTDKIESIGIGLAESAASTADVVLYVIDGSEAPTDATRDRLEAIDPGRTVLVVNKMDLASEFSGKEWQSTRGAAAAEVPWLNVSAKTGEGFAELRETLVDRVGRDRLNWIARERVVLNSRLISLLEAAQTAITSLRDGMQAKAPLEILALDAREVLNNYETATGKRYTDNLLDTIFSRFCIGK